MEQATTRNGKQSNHRRVPTAAARRHWQWVWHLNFLEAVVVQEDFKLQKQKKWAKLLASVVGWKKNDLPKMRQQIMKTVSVPLNQKQKKTTLEI